MVKPQYLASQQSHAASMTSIAKLPRRQRQPHHKVKTGCKACKIRRQKCDERRPLCSGCSRHSTTCVYPVQQPARPVQGELATSSLRRPTITRCLPVSPSTDLDLADLELFHQFLTSTCIASGQLPEITTYIQSTIFSLAEAYPFVMRGILAMGATHLSWLRPSRQAHYAMLAAKNHQNALPHFQSSLSNLNEENCQAVISYSKSLLWCSFASNGSSEETKITSGTEKNWLPQWFCLLRGSCHVVEYSKAWIKDGPHIIPNLDETVDYSEIPEAHQISILMSQMRPFTKSTSCMQLLQSLREAFARASMHQHNTPLRNAVNFWARSLPDEYLISLQKKEQWAMVVLAHFCLLVHRFEETSWFMRGHAARLLQIIIENLDATWRCFVQWPCRVLGVELKSPMSPILDTAM